MHLYNAWLPPPVAEESKREKLAFAGIVQSVKELYNPDDPESDYATLKWVSVLDLFIKAKSELSVEDVSAIVEIGMKLFQISENKLHAQVRWGNFLVRLLNWYIFMHTFILSNTDKQQIWQTIEKLLTDNQVEVREHSAAVLAGLMKGGDEYLVDEFRSRAYGQANLVLNKRKQRSKVSAVPIASIHGSILALAVCLLSVPYDVPSWLPDHVTLLAHFVSEPSPLKSTVTKAIAEFHRTHADTWNIKKDSFTEDQLEVLADTSSSSSYFA